MQQEGSNVLEEGTRSILEQYVKQSQITDPGKCAYLLDDLPRSIQVLVKTVQGLLVSLPWEDAYGAAGMPTFDVTCSLMVKFPFQR